MQFLRLTLAIFSIVCLAPNTAKAQSTWTADSGANVNWSTAANWSNPAPVSNGTRSLIFNPSSVTVVTIPAGVFNSTNDLTNFTASGITFDNTANSPSGRFVLSGNQITLGGNIVTTGSTGSPTHTMNMAVVLNGNRTITTELNNNLTLSGDVSETGGSRSLTKEGGGTLTLSGANSFTGGIVVNGGSLQIGNGGTTGSLGSGSVTVNTAMTFNRTDTAGVFSNAIAGSGTVTKTGTGTITLSGTNTYTGQTVVSNGTLVGTGANAFGSTSEIRIAGAGTLSLRGDSSTNFVRASDSSAYGIRTTASGATINVDQATVAGTSARSMSIGALGTTSTAANYQVNFTGANNTSLNVGAVTGAASGSSGTVTIANNISGGGNLTIASYTSANSGGGETLTFSGSGNTTVTGAITPSSTALALTKTGTGTLTLNGSNTYTGNTTINGGTVIAGHNSALGTAGTVTLNASDTTLALADGVNISRSLVVDNTGSNKTLALQTGATSAQYSGGITINESVAGDFKVDVGTGGTLTVAGSIGGAGAAGLTKSGAGTLVLSASNSYAGGTNVSNGTLQLGNGSTGGSLSTSSAISVASGATFSVNQSDTVTQGTDFSGSAITGQGGVTQAGSGTTILTAANSYTGVTNVNAGTLRINGNQSAATGNVTVSSGATLGGSGTIGGATTISGIHSPGNSPGLQTFNGGLTYLNGSSLTWELADNTISGRGTLFDGIDVTGGTLTINSGVTSNLVFNASGSLVDWSNSFWAINRQWLVYDNANAPTLGDPIFTTIGVSNDKDGDSLASARGTSFFSWSKVGNDIYLNYTFAAAAVPEPGTFGLMGLVGLVGVLRHRRQRKEMSQV